MTPSGRAACRLNHTSATQNQNAPRIPGCSDGTTVGAADDVNVLLTNPSTGAQMAEAPCCTQDEVNATVEAAARAGGGTIVQKRM